MNSPDDQPTTQGTTNLLDVLTAIRPVIDTDQVWDLQDQAAVRTRITSQPQVGITTYARSVSALRTAAEARPRRRRTGTTASRSWKRTAGLLAAAATIATVITVGANPTTAISAFADYTPVSANLTPAEIATQVEACRSLLKESGTSGSPNRLNITDAVAVVVDRRGSWTHTVLVQKAAAPNPALYGDCMLNATTRTGGSSIGDPLGLTSNITTGINILSGTSIGNISDQDFAASLFGKAAANVVAIYVDLPDGQRINALISNGWWSAWWPGDLPDEDHAILVTSRTSTGATHTSTFNGH